MGHIRRGLLSLDDERQSIPAKLSNVRRLFGYTADNEATASIGKDDYSQLMGRISINAAIEMVEKGIADTDRSRLRRS